MKLEARGLWMLIVLGALAPAPARAQGTQVLIAEARDLANQGRHYEAMEWFLAALMLDPTDGATRCELGFSAWRCGDLLLAEHELDQGLSDLAAAGLTNARGACLYNRGRVAEDRGQLAVAAWHYQESLAARPGNTVVRSRLEQVRAALAAGAEAGPRPTPPVPRPAAPFAPFSAASPAVATGPASPTAADPFAPIPFVPDGMPAAAPIEPDLSAPWSGPWSAARALALGASVTAGGAAVVFLLAFAIAFLAARRAGRGRRADLERFARATARPE